MMPITKMGFFIKDFKIMGLLSVFSSLFALKTYAFLPDKLSQEQQKDLGQ